MYSHDVCVCVLRYVGHTLPAKRPFVQSKSRTKNFVDAVRHSKSGQRTINWLCSNGRRTFVDQSRSRSNVYVSALSERSETTPARSRSVEKRFSQEKLFCYVEFEAKVSLGRFGADNKWSGCCHVPVIGQNAFGVAMRCLKFFCSLSKVASSAFDRKFVGNGFQFGSNCV